LHPSLVLLQRSFERLHVGSKSAFDWHGIDEGFGSLDADALDLAVDALEPCKSETDKLASSFMSPQ
jgi:hypothetical protein